MNRVIADVPDHPQGHVPDKYDVKEVIKQSVFHRSTDSCTIRAAPSYIFRCFLKIGMGYWQVRLRSAQD